MRTTTFLRDTLPKNYRWMEQDECEHYSAHPEEWADLSVLSIRRTEDSLGNKYTQDEADLAVRKNLQVPESLERQRKYEDAGEVQVAFTCPVEVVVNVATGEVTRVVMIDEGIQPELIDGKHNVNFRNGYSPVEDEDVIKRAVEIADGDAEWPSWQAGW